MPRPSITRASKYHPGDREAKYFLSEFCSLYYRRNRYTIHDDFTKALYFLDGEVANDTMEQSKKDDTINAFLSNSSSPEVDIDVQKVVLEPMQNAPYGRRWISTVSNTPRRTTRFSRKRSIPRTSFFSSKTMFPTN